MAKKPSAGIGLAGAIPMMPKPTAEQIKQDQQYRAEDDLRTMHRAHQIVTDKVRHGAVKQLARQHVAAVEKMGKRK